MNRGQTGVGLKGAVAFIIGEDLDEVAAVATEEGGVAVAAVVEAAVGTETYELAVGAEEGEEGVEEINSSNNNKVKVHQRPAEEAEGVGQKEVWPMPVVEEEVVMANQLLLLRRLVVSRSRTVVKTSHHRSRNEHPVVLVLGAVGEGEEGVATGDAEVAVLAVRVRAELEVAVTRRRRKETEITPLPLRVAVHSLADNQLRL